MEINQSAHHSFEEFLLKSPSRWHSRNVLIRIHINRNTFIAIIFSLLVHALVLFLALPHLQFDKSSLALPTTMEVSLAPPVHPQVIEPLPEPEKPLPKPVKVKPKVITQKSNTNAKPSFSVPDVIATPAPSHEVVPAKDQPVDMMAYVNARRAQRQASEVDAAKQNAEAVAREIGPTAEQVREERIKNNFKNGTNGIFEITSLSARHAAFSFRGWTNDYSNARRESFEVEAFLVCTRLMLAQGRIKLAEMRFLLSGLAGPAPENPPPKPAHWIPDRVWAESLQAAILPHFVDLPKSMAARTNEWKVIYDSVDPASLPLPGALNKCSDFEKLSLIRCLRPDKIVPQVQKFVTKDMGAQYMDPPTFNLQDCFEDSTPVTPLIFILSPRADPNQALIAYSEVLDVGREMLSLGQGQGPIAQGMIHDAVDKGSWVILQNCHLSPSWMPKLEAIVEQLDLDRCNTNFRLWLTSYPSDNVPVAILQNGIKMTLQPPKGVRANMLATYATIDEHFFTSSKRPALLRKLHFALAFFHASLQERIKYGALGFNIQYSFTESDYLICQTQVKMFLEEFDDIPWEALRHTAGLSPLLFSSVSLSQAFFF